MSSTDLSLLELAQQSRSDRLLARASAAYHYYSGRLDALYLQSLAGGAVPWRVIKYEHVSPADSPAIPLALNKFVTPKTFRRQLYYLHRHCHVLSLDQLISRIEKGEKVAPKTVVLTFDNGWSDFADYAAPILFEFGFPATVFVSTAYVGTENLYWSDKILASLLTLFIAGVPLGQMPELKEFIESTETPAPTTVGETVRLANLLINSMSAMSDEQVTKITVSIGWFVEKVGGFKAERMFLNWDQIQKLAAAGISFGIQGHNHRSFRRLTGEEIAQEVAQAVSCFDEHQLAPCQTFCYPEGVITREGRKVLSELGLRYSVAEGDYALAKNEQKLCAIISRVGVHEGNSFCTEFFAARLWGRGEVAG